MGLAIITVQDLPQHVTHQQLASAIDELHHARRLLLQQLTEQVVEKLEAVHRLQARLDRLLRHVASLYTAKQTLTLVSNPVGVANLPSIPIDPRPLAPPLHEYAMDAATHHTDNPSQMRGRDTAELYHRFKQYAPRTGRPHMSLPPPTTVSLTDLLPAGPAGASTPHAQPVRHTLDPLAFFGAPTPAARPGQHLPVLSSRASAAPGGGTIPFPSRRAHVVQSVDSEDDGGHQGN